MGTSTFTASDGHDYEILATSLGAGGYGAVQAGRRSDGTDVAIKRVAGGAARGPAANRELQIALTLGEREREYLLAPVAWAVDADDVLLVMPRAERSLADELAAYPTGMPHDILLPVLRDVTKGLIELKTAGIVHRDLKPHNVLLYRGRWHLADFGISRDLDAQTATVTFQNHGTAMYLAPERWQGRSATHKSDLYALGCIAHETATGHPVFRGTRDELERQHLYAAVAVPPGPPTFARWVLRLLDKNPAGRHQDAAAALVALPHATNHAVASTLAMASLQRHQRQHHQGVVDAQGVAADAIGNARVQALADLDDVGAAAAEQAQRDLPDLRWDDHGEVQRFEVDQVRLELHLWPGVPASFDDDHLIMAGEVLAFVSGQRRCMANIVCETDRSGRQHWYLDTVTPMALAGIVGQAQGLPYDDFFKHYPYFSAGLDVWQRHRDQLTPETIIKLLAQVIGTAE